MNAIEDFGSDYEEGEEEEEEDEEKKAEDGGRGKPPNLDELLKSL